MSKRSWFVVRALVTLVVVGLLIAGGFVIHRLGWSQGYRMGELTAGGEESAAPPYAPFGFGRPGLLLTAGLLLLLLIVIGKFFRFWAWKMACGPWMMAGGPWIMGNGPKGKHWAAPRAWHWHRAHPHGPMPPWCWGWEEPSSEEDTGGVEPSAETGNAEA